MHEETRKIHVIHSISVSHFIVVVWNQICNISKGCLHIWLCKTTVL